MPKRRTAWSAFAGRQTLRRPPKKPRRSGASVGKFRKCRCHSNNTPGRPRIDTDQTKGMQRALFWLTGHGWVDQGRAGRACDGPGVGSSRRHIPCPPPPSLDRRGLGRVAVFLPVEVGQAANQRAGAAVGDGRVVDAAHRHDAAGGGGDEHLVGGAQRIDAVSYLTTATKNSRCIVRQRKT